MESGLNGRQQSHTIVLGTCSFRTTNGRQRTRTWLFVVQNHLDQITSKCKLNAFLIMWRSCLKANFEIAQNERKWTIHNRWLTSSNMTAEFQCCYVMLRHARTILVQFATWTPPRLSVQRKNEHRVIALSPLWMKISVSRWIVVSVVLDGIICAKRGAIAWDARGASRKQKLRNVHLGI